MTEPDKTNDENSEEPKIVVDTDWKEQVAKEKEQAAAKDADEAETGERSSRENDFVPMDKSVQEEPTETSLPDDDEMASMAPPPASFEVLISMLFTQAMAALGQMPNPATGKPEVNKPFAKHYIDTLEMLGEKTQGNLSDDETKMLSEALHALRMAYVGTRA